MSRVKLVAHTKPTDMSFKELVVYCARVSNPANQDNHETSDKLFDYLVKNKHWSPLEMVHVTMEINTTRDIARQILRHRSFAFQEFSQRYAIVEPTLFPPEMREARLQDEKNRQNSTEIPKDDVRHLWFATAQHLIWEQATMYYREALEKGIAKEQARALLPEGLTPSRIYMAGSLRSWIHYCELRAANGTQKEHQEIAIEAQQIIEDLLNGKESSTEESRAADASEDLYRMYGYYED